MVATTKKTTTAVPEETYAERLAAHPLADVIILPCAMTAAQRLQASLAIAQAAKETTNDDMASHLEGLCAVIDWIRENATTDTALFDERTTGMSLEACMDFVILYMNAVGE